VEWQPQGQPETVKVHDFPDDRLGKASPYGVFDMTRNEAWVSVGKDHDTSAFAVASIRQWWKTMRRAAYPEAKERLITADAGGSNGYRIQVWKVEHRLFSHITQNWRGKPLTSYETIVNLIGSTKTTQELRVKARIDKHLYPTGVEITKAEVRRLALHKDSFLGDWNYQLSPRQS